MTPETTGVKREWPLLALRLVVGYGPDPLALRLGALGQP